jgi:ferritin-like metal-binding protein YciE
MDMSLGMDIASYSMANASLSVMSNVSVAMLDKTLDLQKTMGDNITKMMEQSVNPSLGGNIDIRV